MCGIVFSYPLQNNVKQQGERVRKAMTILKHRGPDEGNICNLTNVIIAHQRLSIIDLSNSHQPMPDPSKRFYLSFNGEIYNYRQLRKQLQPHWNFRTEGDTEVILAGLIVEGDNFVKKMQGMWALALWDVQQQRLFLSRDRLGKKPLYYFHSSRFRNEIHCASELPALMTLLHKKPVEDDNSRVDYLKYGYFLPGFTIYKDIFEVLPGNNLVFRKGEITTEQYWQLKPESGLVNQKDAQEKLSELFETAVQKRLVADVEVGAFLSGGIDSSLIVAQAQQSMDKKLKTFSIGFEESSFDETKYAQQIATLYQTEHYKEMLPATDYNSLGEMISCHLGQPFMDSSLIATRLVSEVAAKHVKVVLSGDGADELFSGYQRYTSRSILRWYNKLPLKVKKNVESVIRAIPEPHKHHSASLIKKAHLFADAVNRMESETPYVAPLFFSKLEFEKLTSDSWSKGHRIPSELEETSLDDISRMMYADTLIYLPQDILLKVDRASMASSLETRTPFLDHQLVEFAFSIPPKWHRKLFSGKKMLKNTFTKQLPDNIWKRRKQGFGVPQSVWFKQKLGENLLQLLEEVESPLNHSYIKQLLQDHRQGKRDYGGKLWLLYSYFLWRKITL